MLLLNSDNFDAKNAGYIWLQGVEVHEAEKTAFEFSRVSLAPKDIVEGLSWLMSLKGPSVLAFDQLDAVVAQYYTLAGVAEDKITEEQEAARAIAKSIIGGIGNGFLSLRDSTIQTLSLLSCLEATWKILTSETISTVRDRFRDPILLGTVTREGVGEEIIKLRLREAYQETQFTPPYETYPFSSSFFETSLRQLPRQILKRCEKHREKCLRENSVSELHSFNEEISGTTAVAPKELEQIDKDFAAAQRQVAVSESLQESEEDSLLAAWLQTACYCLTRENPTLDTIDATWEKDFPGGKSYPLLHGRIRLIFREEQEREKHFCIRAVQRKNALAYQTRMKAAMTASGVDRKTTLFRRLMIVRSHSVPGGSVTQDLTTAFRESGGSFGHPSESEICILGGLHKLESQRNPHFDRWLCDRRPVSKLSFMKEAVDWLFEGAQCSQNESEGQDHAPDKITGDTNDSLPNEPSLKDLGNGSKNLSADNLPIGVQLRGKQERGFRSIPLRDLTKHTVVLAGSGSGKTVLIKRIVEEAALLDIPSIVIDGANDLSQMGDRWNVTPEGWQPGDEQKVERYHRNTEVIVWTPGRETANPINLNPLPDFSAVIADQDELSQAIDMARASLQDVVASGKSQTARVKRGILRELLEYFARSGGGNLHELSELMADAPIEEIGNYSNAQKRIEEMADLLNAQISTNPLLRQSGTPLDPAVLFGSNTPSGKTRLSILNFIGLTGLEQQQQFLNQLAMTLFTWIKKNPAPIEQPLRGLLVIDEAKDFVPSRGSTPCKESIIRLVAQARKYGLGIVFATQAPKSIDHNIIANCSTQFYGRANSPASLDVIKEQLAQRGSTGQDVSKLPRGQFYVFSESISPPIKVSTPLCLSRHPATPPGEAEVIRRAKSSRDSMK
ncbi:MAG: ATP-binding protein [Cyanobacteria bacterium P01_A01_bin.116]